MRIDGDGVGFDESPEILGSAGHRRGEAPIRAIDVKPQSSRSADRRDSSKRVDGAGAHRPGSADDEERPIAGSRVRVNLMLQLIDVQAEVAVRGE